MCDCVKPRGYGWRGWQVPSKPALMSPCGAWHDLSHPLGPDMPRIHFFPQPVFEQVRQLPTDLLNVTRMDMVVHMGTHIDSPRHFFLDGPALEDVPLDRLTGRGVVWPVSVDDNELIEIRHLEGLSGVMQPGDILLLNSGWHHHVGSARYDDDHPALSEAAAHWLVSQGVKMLCVDFPTPDLPAARRPASFDYPIHRILLSHGVMVAEHLTGLDALSGRTVEVVSAGLNIVGGDGAPARIIARAVST